MGKQRGKGSIKHPIKEGPDFGGAALLLRNQRRINILPPGLAKFEHPFFDKAVEPGLMVDTDQSRAVWISSITSTAVIEGLLQTTRITSHSAFEILKLAIFSITIILVVIVNISLAGVLFFEGICPGRPPKKSPPFFQPKSDLL
jgi:hypothetical protein